MPCKLEINEHVLFLWDCFQSARDNGGRVDSKAVGELYSLSTNAANMRLHRLANSIAKAKEVAAGGGGDAKESAKEGTPKSKAKAKKPDNEKTSTPKSKRKHVTANADKELGPKSSVDTEGKKIKVEEDYQGD